MLLLSHSIPPTELAQQKYQRLLVQRQFSILPMSEDCNETYEYKYKIWAHLFSVKIEDLTDLTQSVTYPVSRKHCIYLVIAEALEMLMYHIVCRNFHWCPLKYEWKNTTLKLSDFAFGKHTVIILIKMMFQLSPEVFKRSKWYL